ncbi:MAG TPA: SpoIIE family protein phosphatase [Spirochaetales bacterium]|nr:SpoIIE family protein phosphatase [Spirochaetales bacterium]HPD80364.1 SpoIIE family protein phosphatase [Spirochaetales bacterium]HQK34448.1 SpoIIE family protein phosphatase [Spirochaetales bacterium]
MHAVKILNSKKIHLFLLLFFIVSSVVSVCAQEIDLTEYALFIRPGFEPSWILFPPKLNDSSWISVLGNKGSRSVIIRDVGLPGIKKPPLFSNAKMKSQRFTIVIPFTIYEEDYTEKGGVTLFLEQIGVNWQVYFNGTLIHNESSRGYDALPRGVERNVRGALINIDRRLIKSGTNLLAFMIEGDPLSEKTGLTARKGYVIGDYLSLLRKRTQYIQLAFIGVYLFFGIYHLIFYFLRRQNRAYLYFALASFILGIHLLSRTYVIHDVILDTRITDAIRTGTLYILLPMFVAFIDVAIHKRLSKFALVLAGIAGIFFVVQLFVFTELINFIWSIVGFIPAIYVLYRDLYVPYRHALRHYKRITTEKKQSVLFLLVRSFQRVDMVRFLQGMAVVIATSFLNIIAFGGNQFEMMAQIGFLILVFGSATLLAAQFFFVYRHVELTNMVLEKKVNKRTEELSQKLKEQDVFNKNLTETAQKLERAHQEAQMDLRIATQVQIGFFPSEAPRTSAWEAAFVFIPASGVSGDFYDFYTISNALAGIVVADVSGHGIASGLITVLARSIFYRNFLKYRNLPLGKVMSIVNKELCDELQSVEHYLTAALLRLSDDGSIEYSNAAHTEIVYKSSKKPYALELRPPGNDEYRGLPMGRKGIESLYKSIRFKVQPGDVILVYTDGISEARNVDRQEFGQEGILSALSSAPQGSAQGMLDYIIQEWRFFTSGAKMADDVTAILLKKL